MSPSDSIQVLRLNERPTVTFEGGALYRAVIGDDTGTGIPVRTGYQYSPPGYQTPLHSHPYTEIITVIAGRGEAWRAGEDARIALDPGVTIVLPPGVAHAFRTLGPETLVTFGIHAHGARLVDVHEAAPAQAR